MKSTSDYSGTDSGMIMIDVFSFGLIDETDLVNNAIYRLELEENGDNSSDFTGTLEYIGLNQVNILNPDTYDCHSGNRCRHHTDI